MQGIDPGQPLLVPYPLYYLSKRPSPAFLIKKTIYSDVAPCKFAVTLLGSDFFS